MQKIVVMNREDAIRYTYCTHDNETVMVSISTPCLTYRNKPEIRPHNKVKTILRMWFDDIDNKNEVDAIKPEDGQKIAAFVKRHSNDNFIVHCDAGQSRSAGVAAAISKYLTGDDSYFFSGRYVPNMLCYRTVLEALYSE